MRRPGDDTTSAAIRTVESGNSESMNIINPHKKNNEWIARFAVVEEKFLDPECTTQERNIALGNMTHVMNDENYPSIEVIELCNMVDFCIAQITPTEQLPAGDGALRLLERLIVHGGPELFMAIPSLMEAWPDTAFGKIHSLMEAGEGHNILCTLVHLLLSSARHSLEFLYRMYHEEMYRDMLMHLQDYIYDTISRLDSIEPIEKRQEIEEMMIRIHTDLFEIVGLWITKYAELGDIDVPTCLVMYSRAFDCTRDNIQRQVCNRIRLMLSRNAELWIAIAQTDIFPKLWQLCILNQQIPDAIDIFAEALILEDRYRTSVNITDLINFEQLSAIMLDIYANYGNCSEDLFISSLALLANSIACEKWAVPCAYRDEIFGRGVELLNVASSEVKETVAFLIITVIGTIDAREVWTYAPALEEAFYAAESTTCEDLAEHSIKTARKLIEKSVDAGVNLEGTDELQQIISFLLAMTDYDVERLSDKANEALNRIEEIYGLTIDDE